LLIINCGFPEPHHITEVAIPILLNFANKLDLQWMGSIAFGGGEMIQGRHERSLDESGSFGKKAMKTLDKMVESVTDNRDFGDKVIELISLKIFYNRVIRRFMVYLNNRSWRKIAEDSGGQVDAQPYFKTS
jgi:hypothetical protein